MQKRPDQISTQFISILEEHLKKIISGDEDYFLEIKDIANLMHIDPRHLSNTIRETLGKSPCDICNEQTIDSAKSFLENSENSIASIARQLTFEPTNFTKYFKKHTGKTPSEFRKIQILKPSP